MMVRVDLVKRRRQIYRHYAATGSPPALTAGEAAALEAAHAAVLDRAGAVAFANPFATGPAPFRINTKRRIYHAICAWDALGVLAALHSDGTVQSACPDCDQPISVSVRRGALASAEAVVHFLVPAARWYEDLGFS
jgi:hypothetical protein